MFRFAGKLLAKAMIEKVPVNIKLNTVILKQMVGRSHKLSINDVKQYDTQIFKSLKFLIKEAPQQQLDMPKLMKKKGKTDF